MFILIASFHNFTDDNSLSNIAKTIDSLKQTFKSECKVNIKWFHENKMIVNLDKFQAIFLDKRRSNNTKVKFIIGLEQIQAVPSVDILGITIDDKLNFNLHIDKICLKSANQLNALVRLKRFLGNEERKVLINSFVLSNFNYCPLVWMLTSTKSLHKMEAIQERVLRFMLNDYESSYEDLFKKSGNPSMNLRRTRSLCIEIYKTINNLNPKFMKNLFEVPNTNGTQREQYKLNLEIPKSSQVSFGTKSLCIQGPRVWNALPFHNKSKENLQAFKYVIKFWNGSKCSCNICFNSNI